MLLRDAVNPWILMGLVRIPLARFSLLNGNNHLNTIFSLGASNNVYSRRSDCLGYHSPYNIPCGLIYLIN